MHGRRIKAGDKVTVWYASGNYDEEKFADPFRLDLGRQPNRHLTFGLGGPHFCLGAHLAKLEVRIWLEEMIPYLDRIELAGPPVRLRSNFFNGIKRLPVRARLTTRRRGVTPPRGGRGRRPHDERARRARDPAALHRPARRRARQGHPDRALRRDVRRGRRLLRRRDGHRSRGTRPSSAARRATSTSRSSPTSTRCARCRGSPRWRGASARPGRSTAPSTGPSCPRALLQRVVDAYAERGLTPIVGPELEFFLAERDPAAENGLRRYVDELSRVYTVGAVSDPREIVLRMLLWCDELGLAGVRREPRVHELAVRDQHQALGGARRRRPRVHAQGGGEGDRRARGAARDLHGPPICRPGRLRLPRPPLARGRRTASNAFADAAGPEGLSPLAAQLHRGRDRARAGPAGAARADDQRLQADPPRQPRADACELGPRQPHRVLPGPERARLARARRDPHRRRLRLPAPDHRRAAARRARRDRARPRRRPSPVVGDAYRLDDAHAGSALPADLGAALDALEADTVLDREARRRSSSRRSSR